MSDPRTLIDLLAARARETPETEAVCFRATPERETSVSYGELWRRSRAFAGGLQREGVGLGDRVVVAVPNQPAFLVAFYGTLAAGATAVPVFPHADPARILHLVRLSDAQALAVPPGASTADLARLATEAGVLVLPVEESPEPEVDLPDLDPEVVALLQYTSGSTADPRGVQIPHGHLLTNLAQMVTGMEITAADVFVSWLPVYHDMGLILMALAPLYVGARLVLLPTSLHSPHPWLSAITEHRGTFTAAPDTAYRLCVARGNPEGRYDLASLRVALDAAEPVRPSTLEAFESAFGLANVMAPGYGLAEATVGVSMWPPGTARKVDAQGRPSVGPPFPGITVRIVDGDRALPPGEIGEIVVQSPAVTTGYRNNPEANAALWWNGDGLRTGDLGYLDAAGDLFIVGRTKNVIVQAGQTLYAADVEGAVADLPFVRRVAAVGIEGRREIGEHLVVFVEIGRHRAPPPDECARLVAEVVQRIHGRFGVRPARVYLIAPRTLPHTSNGKMQHASLREAYARGELHESLLFPTY